MTLNDPAVRKQLARLKLVYRDMKREQRLLIRGRAYTKAVETDVARTWRRYDYVPPSEMRGE